MLTINNVSQKIMSSSTRSSFINSMNNGSDTLDNNIKTVYYSPIFRSRFPKIHPLFEQKYDNMALRIMHNNLNDFELTSDLNVEEQKQLITNVGQSYKEFVNLLLGEKPSVLIYGSNDFLRSNENFDVLSIVNLYNLNDKTISIPNTVIFNKVQTKNIILQNKDIYILRMDLDKNSTCDEIYSELISKNSPFKSNQKHDLIGITLGYSPINSMLFQLEKDVYGKNYLSRKDVSQYKKDLLNYLVNGNSSYNNLPEKQISNLKTSLINIREDKYLFKPVWEPFGFCQINIATDDNYNQTLLRHILRAFEKCTNILN